VLNSAVKGGLVLHDVLDVAVVNLRISADVVSLHLVASGANAEGDAPAPRGSIALPIDPLLGPEDPNLRLLRAMQAAAAAEIDRLQSAAASEFVHVPQRVDLSDLQRFPSSTAEDDDRRPGRD